MKSPKNRKKYFRVHCANCHATVDSLLYTCPQCRNRLYTNMEEGELQLIEEKVAEMEEHLVALEGPPPSKQKPGESNPYQPLDQAWAVYRSLRTHSYLPGMTAYLDRVLEALLPFKLRLQERTLRANWVFLIILVAFPVLTLAIGMKPMIVGLLALPAIVWAIVTFRAARDLRLTKARLAQISSDQQ
ncbi:MAG: hypothetical protein U0176_22530 [Bacteroidia bacterium]